MELGVAFSAEELGPNEIVRYAALAEEVGFGTGWVSDHFHPWIDAQGNSPFVWSVLGGIAHATETMRFGTGVTCPTVRIHPAVIAQAAATTQCMFDGRFWLGVGSGEALNEHILGTKWPEASVRLDMLEEAVQVIRALWKGEQTSHYGKYFTVENARLYTLPEQPPPIIVSAFGDASVTVAARCGDGLVSTKPDGALLRGIHARGRTRAEGRAAQGRMVRFRTGGRRPCLHALADIRPRGRTQSDPADASSLRAGGHAATPRRHHRIVSLRTRPRKAHERDPQVSRRRI